MIARSAGFAPAMPFEDPAMLRLACLLLSFAGAPAACTPAAPAFSAPAPAPTATPAAPCRGPRLEEPVPEFAATAHSTIPQTTAAEAAPTPPPVAAPAVAPRPTSAPPQVRAPSWQQRLPGMFR